MRNCTLLLTKHAPYIISPLYNCLKNGISLLWIWKVFLFHQNGSQVLSLSCFQNISNIIYRSWNKIFQWGESEMSQWELTENVDKIGIFPRNVFMLSHHYFVWNICSLGPLQSIHQNYFDTYFSLLKHPMKKVCATKCIISWFSILDFISCQQCRSITWVCSLSAPLSFLPLYP